MEFSVPPDCKDSPFHFKWRLSLLEFVKDKRFQHLPQDVKQAIKKFLDHPTSLPYDESKIDNFLTNSMIIVDKEVLRRALEWFALAKTAFFETEKISPRFTLAMLVPSSWTDAKLQSHFDTLRGEANNASPHLVEKANDASSCIERISKASAKITADSAEEILEILRADQRFCRASTFSDCRPRLYLTRETCTDIHVATVEVKSKAIKLHRQMTPAIEGFFNGFVGCRGTVVVINFFHDNDGFLVVFDSASAVDAVFPLTDLPLKLGDGDALPIPIRIIKGF